jgi:cell division protein FtsA
MAAPIAIIDVGTSKLGCLIVRDGHVLAGAHAPSTGIKSGEIVNPDAAHELMSRTVRLAIADAGVPVHDAVLAIGCGRIAAPVIRAALTLDPPIVRIDDIKALATSTMDYAAAADRCLLHVEHHHFTLDGQTFVEPPVERFGRQLAAERTVVTADRRPVDRLITAVERAGLAVRRLFPGPAAAALAVTTPEERRQGITVLDFGGGTTSYAMYVGGRLVGAGAIALGGHHLTLDVAEALELRLEEAERIKKFYGIEEEAHDGAGPAPAGLSAAQSYAERPPADDRAERPQDLRRAPLRHVLLPRVGMILRLVANRIDAEPFALLGAQQVVMTGGAAELAGLEAEAGAHLGRPVRMRRPIGAQVPPAVAGAPWAVIAGAADALADPRFGIGVVVPEERGRARA